MPTASAGQAARRPPRGRHSDTIHCTEAARQLGLRHTLPVNIPRFLWVAAAFWTLFGLVTGIQVWIAMLDHGHNVPWLLSFYLLVWIAWLAPTYLIAKLARRFPIVSPNRRAVVVHALASTTIGLLHSLYEIALMLGMRPYDRMTASLAELDVGLTLLSRLPLEWILYCMVLGVVTAFEYYQRYHERALQAAQLERSLADAKLHALELQLQPHFLFNTLNALASLVRTKQNEQAIKMIAGLAELLRYSLEHAGRQNVSLREEINMLRRYLEIEQARFPDRMQYNIHLPEALQQAAVPMLILQPLAENAVRHGIAKIAAGGSIDVEVSQVGDRLQLRMRNPAPPSSAAISPAAASGIGLRNTRERLQTLYGEAATFKLSAENGSVLAQLDLPLRVLA